MRRILFALALAALACALPQARTPTPIPPTRTPFTSPIPPTAPTVAPPAASFTVSVLVDLGSEPVPSASIDSVLAEATRILVDHTGIGFELVEVVEGIPSSTVDGFARQYVAGASAVPNGLIVLSYGDDDQARTYGGYSFWIAGPGGFHNAFVSPVAGDSQVYVAVLHWSHRYARCGYSETEDLISSTSLDGECMNQPGTACVEHNGYSFCSNALGLPYAEAPTAFLSANVVHEFLHPFGVNGVYDHYGTEECIEAMGWTAGGWAFSLEQAQRNAGMCPNVFEAFASSFAP